MPDIIVGTTDIRGFSVKDLNGNYVTGLTLASFSVSLNRRHLSTSFAAAPEGVSIAERGTGSYEASFTPGSDAAGYIYRIRITEAPDPTIPLSQEALHEWYLTADSTSEVYTESDAFCSLADVQAKVQRGSFSGTSAPTSGQILDFMAWRAVELEAVIAQEGYAKTVATGGSPLGTTGNDRVLGKLLRNANATIAAADAIMAFDVRDVALPSGVVNGYMMAYESLVKDCRAYVNRVISPAVIVGGQSAAVDVSTLYTTGTIF
jgi:hypothetical protein